MGYQYLPNGLSRPLCQRKGWSSKHRKLLALGSSKLPTHILDIFAQPKHQHVPEDNIQWGQTLSPRLQSSLASLTAVNFILNREALKISMMCTIKDLCNFSHFLKFLTAYFTILRQPSQSPSPACPKVGGLIFHNICIRAQKTSQHLPQPGKEDTGMQLRISWQCLRRRPSLLPVRRMRLFWVSLYPTIPLEKHQAPTATGGCRASF